MKEKNFYLAPETEVVETRLEVMIAASADPDITSIANPFSGIGDEFIW